MTNRHHWLWYASCDHFAIFPSIRGLWDFKAPNSRHWVCKHWPDSKIRNPSSWAWRLGPLTIMFGELNELKPHEVYVLLLSLSKQEKKTQGRQTTPEGFSCWLQPITKIWNMHVRYARYSIFSNWSFHHQDVWQKAVGSCWTHQDINSKTNWVVAPLAMVIYNMLQHISTKIY